MSSSHFAKVPNITIPRSRFKMPFTHKTSFLHGDLIPIDCFEVLPGDTFKLKLSSLIRMSTPIAPIMDNIDCYIHAFFVPTRLLWSDWEKFMGANDGAGYQAGNYRLPLSNMLFCTPTAGHNKLSYYLGKPLIDSTASASGSNRFTERPYLVFKERGYFKIWNEFFRAEQLQAAESVAMDGGTHNSANNWGAKVFTNDSVSSPNWCVKAPKKVNKKFDYFTAATLAPQYGASVTLPLGQYAPIIADATGVHSMINATRFGEITGSTFTATSGNLNTAGITGNLQIDAGSSPSNTEVVVSASNLVADLSQATAATINSLRYAFAVQRYLERSNYGSNHFFEILAVHYGVTSPDSRLQRPEYLGGHKFRININQVLSNSGYAAGVTTTLGEPGAVSVTSDDCDLFTKSFVEFGYVYVLLCTKQDRTYSSMSLKEDMRINKFEWYSPEFANLGDQEVIDQEICNKVLATSITNITGLNNNVFGYQEHWAEYRYRPDRVSGLLNPTASNALSFWTLSEAYTAQPTLSSNWIEEDRSNVYRCLKTGASGPDYIGDFYFDYTATREMPVYSVPGLIDHVGNM